ncbi:hypothetical protein CZ771_12080 [Actinomycetales bacterium JB111]|nr:hypothetical protein CZ771_12080 [Actinomycetales bacterium JB111]
MPEKSTKVEVPKWLVPALVVAIAALLIAFIVQSSRGDSSADDAPAESPTATDEAQVPDAPDAPDAPDEVQDVTPQDLTSVERRSEDDRLAVGPVDAPVALVVFSDFQCQYCARWSDQTLPVLMERVDAGELRIEFRDVNIFGEPSERAARAVYAAAEQGAFLEYHEALFPDGGTRSEGELTDEALVALATELGLDADRFAADMASESTAQQVAANQQLGIDLGAYSTPSFLLAGQPIVGAQPTDTFVDAFEAALAQVG